MTGVTSGRLPIRGREQPGKGPLRWDNTTMNESEVAAAMDAAHRASGTNQAQGTGMFVKAAHMSQQEGRDWQGPPPRDPANPEGDGR